MAYETSWQFGEEDGTPRGSPYLLRFPNNSLIDNLDGTYSYNPAAAAVEYDFIDFDTTATSANKVGRVRWNATDRCLEFDSFINGDIVTNQIGQETWVRVRNNTGSDIGDGKAVYISGVVGNRPTIALARANTEATSPGRQR